MLAASRALLRGLADALAPARCVGCLQVNTWLCMDCWSDFVKHYPALLPCVGCGEQATSQGLTCRQCRSRIPLRGVVSAGSYHLLALQRGVRWLKFKGIQAVAPTLARLVLPRLLLIAPIEHLREEAVLIPIPLHASRQRERGFNQSALIAQHLSEISGIPLGHMLVRHRSTWAQSHLPVDLRGDNIKDSFRLLPESPLEALSARSVALLIDDVTTSGTTLAVAAAALSPLPFSQIWGVTVARG